VGVGQTGAVEVDISLAAVGVPDGQLVGVELALLAGKDKGAHMCRSLNHKTGMNRAQ